MEEKTVGQAVLNKGKVELRGNQPVVGGGEQSHSRTDTEELQQYNLEGILLFCYWFLDSA